ncbi:hypothetical protein AVEN_238573-1, partial [Araneus ventricosus]
MLIRLRRGQRHSNSSYNCPGANYPPSLQGPEPIIEHFLNNPFLQVDLACFMKNLVCRERG